MLSAISSSSDLTINQLKILNKNNPTPTDETSEEVPQQFGKASFEIAAMEQAKREQTDASLRQSQSPLKQSFERQSEVDPVQMMGQSSGSGDDPNKMSATYVSDSGFTSGM